MAQSVASSNPSIHFLKPPPQKKALSDGCVVSSQKKEQHSMEIIKKNRQLICSMSVIQDQFLHRSSTFQVSMMDFRRNDFIFSRDIPHDGINNEVEKWYDNVRMHVESESFYFFEKFLEKKLESEKEDKQNIPNGGCPNEVAIVDIQVIPAEEEIQLTLGTLLRKVKYWMRKYIYQNIYPEHCKTPSTMFDAYLQKRQSPSLLVGLAHLLPLALGNVLASNLLGWNIYLQTSGFGGFCLVNLVTLLFYKGLTLCLEDLMAALPLAGGPYAYSRAMLGNLAGYVVANSHFIVYLTSMSLSMLAFADVGAFIANTQESLDPIWWMFLSVLCVVFVCCTNRISWNLSKQLVLLSLIVAIISFCIGIFFINPSWIIAQEVPSHTAGYFPNGIKGILASLPTSFGWYLRIESPTLFAKESTLPTQHIPVVLNYSWVIFSVFLILISVGGVMVPPGLFEISNTIFPMPLILSSIMGVKYLTLAYLLLLPILIFPFITSIMSSSRLLWAMSRSGYHPAWFSLSNNSTHQPLRAATISVCFSFIISICYRYVFFFPAGTDSYEALIYTMVVAGSMTYIGVGISFIRFQYKYKYINTRNAMGSFGILVAIVIIAVCLVVIMVPIVINVELRGSVVIYVVIMVLFGMYYFVVSRMHLKPTEESLISTLWENVGHSKSIP